MNHLYRSPVRWLWVLLLGIAPAELRASSPIPSDDYFFTCELSFPLAVQTDPNTVYIPFRLVGRLIAVEARADTVAGAFILDTGAERLLLNKNHYRDRRIEQLVSMGNTGAVQAAGERWVDSLIWDNLFFKHVQADVVDLFQQPPLCQSSRRGQTGGVGFCRPEDPRGDRVRQF